MNKNKLTDIKPEKYFSWYTRNDVKFEIIKFLKNKEMMFYIKDGKYSFRYIRCHNVQTFSLMMKNSGAYQHLFNIYNSVATFRDGVDWFGYNLLYRDKEQIKKFRETCHEYITRYDYFIDIDSGSVDDMLISKQFAIILFNLFMKYKIQFELRFSGLGFHFIIPNRMLPNLNTDPYINDENNIYLYLKNISKALHHNISSQIDLKVYDMRRVMKTPYTIATYEHGQYICMPILSREELENFDIKTYALENWLFKSIRGRGTKVFNYKLGKKENFKELIDYLKSNWGEF